MCRCIQGTRAAAVVYIYTRGEDEQHNFIRKLVVVVVGVVRRRGGDLIDGLEYLRE